MNRCVISKMANLSFVGAGCCSPCFLGCVELGSVVGHCLFVCPYTISSDVDTVYGLGVLFSPVFSNYFLGMW